MAIINFPRGVDGCFNNSDCFNNGTCTVASEGGEHYWCSCPKLYDPLDQCASYFYDTHSIVDYVILLFITAIISVISISLFIKHTYKKTRRFFTDFPSKPSQLLITSWITMICCILTPISALLLITQSNTAQFILFSVVPSVYTQCLVSNTYALFEMMIRMKTFGYYANPRYVALQRAIAICGFGGLTLSLVTGLVESLALHGNLIIIYIEYAGLIVGIVVPVIIAIKEYIGTFRMVNDLLTDSIPLEGNHRVRIMKLRLSTWIMFCNTLYVIVCLIIFLAIPSALAIQLFDSIVLRQYLTHILFALGTMGMAIFIHVASRPTNSPNILSTTTTTTTSHNSSGKEIPPNTTSNNSTISINIDAAPLHASSVEIPDI